MFAINNFKESVCRDSSEGFAGGCDVAMKFIAVNYATYRVIASGL